MQSARERRDEHPIYADHFEDFYVQFVHLDKENGLSRLICASCGAGVYGRGGGPPTMRKDGSSRKASRAHFVHEEGADCSYRAASAGVSEEHEALKRFVSRVVQRCDGWDVAVEVAGPSWRADVHSLEVGHRTEGIAVVRHDMHAVFGRHDVGCREVVFEIQHTPQIHAETTRRTGLYREAGCEVIWIFDHEAGSVGQEPSIAVERDGEESYFVMTGICAPAGRPRVDLGQFVEAVLDRSVTFEPFPSGPGFWGRRARGWVFADDLPEVQRQRDRDERNLALSRARALTAREVRTILPTYDVSELSREDARFALGTVLASRAGTIAVHPRPARATGDALARLQGCAVVIVARPEHKRDLVAAGVDDAVLFEMSEIELIMAALDRRGPQVPVDPPPAVSVAGAPAPVADPAVLPRPVTSPQAVAVPTPVGSCALVAAPKPAAEPVPAGVAPPDNGMDRQEDPRRSGRFRRWVGRLRG